jgi:predicted membrane protein
MDQTEILGLIATAFVLISFLMRRAWKIRLINIAGAVLFVIYGLIIDSWAVWVLNAVLIVIHLCFLLFARRKSPKKEPRLVHFQSNSFNANAMRKQSWFLSSKGDRLTDW